MLKFLLLGMSLAVFLGLVGWSGTFGSVFGQTGCNMAWFGLPALLDSDCDRLADNWETSGYNGLNLPAMGSDPKVKDIFLEIDYIGHHKPRPGVIEAVTTAFQNSGVSNGATNPTGIRLHVFVDENMGDPPPASDFCTNLATFPWSNWFGSPLERTNPTLMAAKRDTFHHAIFIHTQCLAESSSGTSDSPGNQLVVSLGYSGPPGWGTDPLTGRTVGSIPEQAGTLMHELGHNLGLLHGGNVTVNCKPNYISVMNWAFQFPIYIGLPFNAFPDYTWAFPDYSRWTSANLIENNLNENTGIGNPPPLPAGVMTAIGGGPVGSVIKTLIPVGKPVDYNGNGSPTNSGVSRNLNNFGYSGTASEATCNSNVIGTSASPLVGHKDWGSLQWKFWGTDSGWYPGSPPPPSPGAPVNASEIKSSQIQMVSASMKPSYNQSLMDKLTFNHTDVTMEIVSTARLQLLQEINYNIQTLPDSAFENTTSANTTRAYFEKQLIGQNNSIANLTQADQLDKAINRLGDLRQQMDSGFGGIKSDDLIVDVKAQALVVPHIDNLRQVLISQK
jgi:hypothetical protein